MRLIFAGLVVAAASARAQAVLVNGPEGRQADSVLAAAAAAGFSGVALIVHNGDVVLRRGYGLANRADTIAFEPSTLVQIGSNTKDFTAVAILQLVERGKLSLDDSIPRFFSGVPLDKAGITIRQLMRHTAGFPLGVGGDFEPIGREALITRVLHTPLESKPGDRERYSNVGFSLLAAIIEQVSGQSYDQYVWDNIITPLGLHDTGYLLPHFDPRRLAHGYLAGTDQGTMLTREHLADGHYWNLRGNGGMISTVEDMATFYNALFDTERLLRTATREARFPKDQPLILAGSDRVNFFMFHRAPRARLEIYLASTTAEAQAPAVHQRLARIFGLDADGPRPTGRPAGAKTIEFPATPLGQAAATWLQAFNDGDVDTRTVLFTERMLPSPGDTRTPAERARAMAAMRGNLGRIAPYKFKAESPTRATIDFDTTGGDVGTIVLEIEDAAPHRVKSFRLSIG